jgi:hypothetical protein
MKRRPSLPGARITEKLARQVCAPALAEQLKAVGVPQDSLWYWVQSSRSTHPLLVTADEVVAHPLFQALALSAFTGGELGELLPSVIEQNGEYLSFLSLKSPRFFAVAYVVDPAERQSGIEIKAATEAEARAQLLLYLIEHQLFTP